MRTRSIRGRPWSTRLASRSPEYTLAGALAAAETLSDLSVEEFVSLEDAVNPTWVLLVSMSED